MASFLPPGFDPATGKLKGLPSGFDPSTGRLRTGGSSSTSSSISRSTSSYSSYSSRGVWGSFNDAIEDAGDWLEDAIDIIRTVVMWIILGGAWIAAIVAVIAAFVEGDIIEGILGIVIGGPIVYYGSFIIAGIGWLAVTILLYIIRFIIWNGWTLLLTLLLAGGIAIGVSVSNNSNDYSVSSTPTATTTATTSTAYVCTASTLNIRSAPSTSASVLGVLKKGQTCEVITFTGGFAQIRYRNTFGYVSSAYVTRK